jgi:hypothetical protein
VKTFDAGDPQEFVAFAGDYERIIRLAQDVDGDGQAVSLSDAPRHGRDESGWWNRAFHAYSVRDSRSSALFPIDLDGDGKRRLAPREVCAQPHPDRRLSGNIFRKTMSFRSTRRSLPSAQPMDSNGEVGVVGRLAGTGANISGSGAGEILRTREVLALPSWDLTTKPT